ncbi:MAG: PP0621 family protein [Pseudomonadota bacterium]
MGLIRLLTWLAIGYFIWLAVTNYLRKQEQRNASRRAHEQKKSQVPERIVKCEQCGLHLPEPEALAANEHWFCTNDHRQRWLSGKR